MQIPSKRPLPTGGKKKPKSQYCLKMWLKYKPEHATTLDGTVTIPKYFAPDGRGRAGILDRMMRHIANRIAGGKLWQARIFEHPGNCEIFTWNDQTGATRGGEMLQLIETIQDLEQHSDA